MTWWLRRSVIPNERKVNMGKRITWICDTCKKETENFVIPHGWIEASFFNNDKFYRYCFCSYSCLAKWSEKREAYYSNKYSVEVKHEISSMAKTIS